jgi:small subunit ribosomal protein S9
VITVNGRQLPDYVQRRALELIVMQPLERTDCVGRYDIKAKVLGGGVAGQAGALRHGISKALIAAEPDLRPPLRRGGFLTRDPRVKERKKYGRKGARRGFQFSKR